MRARERFERMVNEHATDMFRYALALSRNRVLAEDLVQETFLRAWRSLHTLREHGKAKSWLLTTLRREYFRQFERFQPEFDDLEVDHLPAVQDEREAELAAVREAIFTLAPIHRDVLALQVLFGYSGAEIGALLELPRATVNTRLFRARQQLRRQLRTGSEAGPSPKRRTARG